MQSMKWRLLREKTALNGIDVVWTLLVGIFFSTIVVIASIIDALDTFGAKQTLIRLVSSKVDAGLSWLDGLEFTASIVTFVFWGLVGLVSYSFVSALIKLQDEITYEGELSSDDYVRPARKSKTDVMRAEFVGNTVTLSLAALVASSLGLFIFVMLPHVAIYAKSFGLQRSIGNLLYLSASVLLLWVTALASVWLCKLYIHRRVLLAE